MGRGTWLVTSVSGPDIQSEEGAAPTCPLGQIARSAALNRRMPETTLPHCQAQRRRASRRPSCFWTCGVGVSDFRRRFGAAERAVWSVRRVGAAAHSGWMLGFRLTISL
eukprot:12524863-Alexandrium_andersonii.AAC.1